MSQRINGKSSATAVVLTGGGARAAYQAGVLEGVADVLGAEGLSSRFPNIYSGISAGAINAAFLASETDDFVVATRKLSSLWGGLTADQVIRTDLRSVGSLGAGWIRDLSFGGALGSSQSTHLLNTEPLRASLGSWISFDRVQENVSHERIRGLAVTATNYLTGSAVTFFTAPENIDPWNRSDRIGKPAKLTLDHVLASASIPIFFKPVPIDGTYYGDGGIRMTSPLSPAIHLGAERILAIGIRHRRPANLTRDINKPSPVSPKIAVADIAGILMNSVFMDALDADVERMQRINETVKLLSEQYRNKHPSKLRVIPVLSFSPSQDLGALAAGEFSRFPRVIRYLLKGLGASEERGADLLSYLAFENSYTRKLLELGRRDARGQKQAIIDFFTLSGDDVTV